MGIGDVLESGIGIIESNPLAAFGIAAGAGAVVGGVVTGLAVSSSKKKRVSKSRNSRKRGRRIRHTKRGWAMDRKRRSKQKWEVTYQRRKKKGKSRRGIHYTKKGQPYKIMSNGRARFIKKSKGGKK